MAALRSNALVLFAKDPVEGQVKTRLGSLLDSKTTLDLYFHFLADSLDKISAVAGVDRFVGVASEPETDFFQQAGRRHEFTLFMQEGQNLGQRMHRAFLDRFEEGYQRVVIIGADSPSLPIAYMEEAFCSEEPVVIGPATDGGYYLIGMQGGVLDIFQGISWGTGRVLEETLAVVREKRVGAGLLPVWYDVDLPEDLRFLRTHMQWMEQAGLPVSRATLKFLNQLSFE